MASTTSENVPSSSTSTSTSSTYAPYYLLRGNVQPQLTGAINLLEHYKLAPLLKDGARIEKMPQTFEPYIRHLPVMGNETDPNPELGLRVLFRLEEWPIIDDEDDLVLPPLGPELIKGLTLEPGKLEERKRRKKHREKGDKERKHRKHRKKHREGGEGTTAANGSALNADGTPAAEGAEGGERRDKERKHRHKHKRKNREDGTEGSSKESREERRKRRKREQAAADGQPAPPKPEVALVPGPVVGS